MANVARQYNRVFARAAINPVFGFANLLKSPPGVISVPISRYQAASQVKTLTDTFSKPESADDIVVEYALKNAYEDVYFDPFIILKATTFKVMENSDTLCGGMLQTFNNK